MPLRPILPSHPLGLVALTPRRKHVPNVLLMIVILVVFHADLLAFFVKFILALGVDLVRSTA
jgi:hypothetical protein